MKKSVWFALFSAVCLCVVGVRLAFGRLDIAVSGLYTAYDGRDMPIQTALSKGYERVDSVGGEEEAKRILQQLRATVCKTERFDGLTVYYAYSPDLCKFTYVFGKQINVMIAVNGDRVATGSPLLLGSY